MILPDELLASPFAHRGLWNAEAPENSLRAFERACQAGYGVEFDVRLAADDEVMVFHDDSLQRMTGRPELVADLQAPELQATPLAGTDQGIPTLRQVLHQIGGRGMALIELKTQADPDVLEHRVAELIHGYEGPHAVISFNPAALGWFADQAPEVPRGLDVTGMSDAALDEADSDLAYILEGRIDLARPHFLLLSTDMIGGRLSHRYRAAGLPVIAWTARSVEDVAAVANHSDNFIFEGFTA